MPSLNTGMHTNPFTAHFTLNIPKNQFAGVSTIVSNGPLYKMVPPFYRMVDFSTVLWPVATPTGHGRLGKLLAAAAEGTAVVYEEQPQPPAGLQADGVPAGEEAADQRRGWLEDRRGDELVETLRAISRRGRTRYSRSTSLRGNSRRTRRRFPASPPAARRARALCACVLAVAAAAASDSRRTRLLPLRHLARPSAWGVGAHELRLLSCKCDHQARRLRPM